MSDDLEDGEVVEVQGSAAKPYELRRIGPVYSCTCPAWRNQSLAIDRRTCKHLRALRGEAAEQARVGALTAPARRSSSDRADADTVPDGKQPPPLLLAHRWENDVDVTGWWMSEKLDGVRAYFDGRALLSRLGNTYHAPDWLLQSLGDEPLDGELWMGRGRFQDTVGVVRRMDKSEDWRGVKYVVFDSPSTKAPFEERMEALRERFARARPDAVEVHEQVRCTGLDHLRAELQRVEKAGGEGLMMRQPGSPYAVGRSTTLLKVKTFYDTEARVIGHLPGAGRHKGRLGALEAELPDGTRFAIGTGLSDRERNEPPPIGAIVTFRYQELTRDGVPRFPSYVGLRDDVVWVASTTTKPSGGKARRFELIEGSSSKFWEIEVTDASFTVRYGRIGTDGQAKTKALDDAATAQREADKLVAEKMKKGYREV